MTKYITIVVIFISSLSYSQTNLETILKSSEILVNGLSFLKKDKADSTSQTDSKKVESVCVKNRLSQKITFILTGKDEEDNIVKKEMVIQQDGKECCFEIPKGIYTYEIVLANKEIYKKGEYKFYDEITITVKSE
ncbi:hypothetical protein NHF50_00675 [Flavobacterium sp. NRK F10]|uniref:hypothetical protein n=1 Tax=Flavobacterium sp. NRK F10 TaxID=2954931 RepID=UPI00209159E9|nr:hypothetical protein [Flavobacterium sp. NRK F10]MCO6173549.1 hypothetical protein [Flavobacterium sp. NRK F10]